MKSLKYITLHVIVVELSGFSHDIDILKSIVGYICVSGGKMAQDVGMV